jgi:hypothetical protein
MKIQDNKFRIQYYNPELLFVTVILALISGFSIGFEYPYKKIVTIILIGLTIIFSILQILFDPKRDLLVNDRKSNKI